MIVNFEIKDNYAINFEGRHIDLHNNFDFTGFEYDNIKKKLLLFWTKSEGNWVKENEITSLILEHKNVNFLRIIERDSELPDSEDICLAELTFISSEDRQDNISITLLNKPLAEDDIKYIFQSQKIIRVNCEEIKLILTQY